VCNVRRAVIEAAILDLQSPLIEIDATARAVEQSERKAEVVVAAERDMLVKRALVDAQRSLVRAELREAERLKHRRVVAGARLDILEILAKVAERLFQRKAVEVLGVFRAQRV